MIAHLSLLDEFIEEIGAFVFDMYSNMFLFEH